MRAKLPTACTELAENLELHVLLHEMTQNINRKMELRQGYYPPAKQGVMVILVEMGIVEPFVRWDQEAQNTYTSYRLLKICGCKSPGRDFLKQSSETALSSTSDKRSRAVNKPSNVLDMIDATEVGFKYKPAQKSVWKLVTEYFPQLVIENGLNKIGQNSRAFAHQLKEMQKIDSTLSLEEIEWCMFRLVDKHKDWCKGKTPWKVFISRINQLREEYTQTHKVVDWAAEGRKYDMKNRVYDRRKAREQKVEKEEEEDDEWERHIYGLGL